MASVNLHLLWSFRLQLTPNSSSKGREGELEPREKRPLVHDMSSSRPGTGRGRMSCEAMYHWLKYSWAQMVARFVRLPPRQLIPKWMFSVSCRHCCSSGCARAVLQCGHRCCSAAVFSFSHILFALAGFCGPRFGYPPRVRQSNYVACYC